MGFFDSFFGDKKTQTNNSTQSGTSSFGLTPAVQDYWSSISGMFGPNTWNPVGPNQYQTQAAGTQAGLGASLMPAYGAAGGIASGGINEGDISRFMNPYTQNVIDTTLGTMRRSDAIANAGSQGQAAKLGALSGTNPLVARSLNEDAQARARNSTMAQLQNQNYAQAAEMAKASTNAQLSGIGAMNSTVGNMAGINQGLFGMGSQFYNQQFQNQMMPYQLAKMGTQTLAGLSPFSGQSSTGNSSGTSTTMGTPSPFSIGMNIAGLGASLFSDERIKENVHPIGETYDGQPIYKYNYKGEPTTQIGLMAQDVEQHTPEAVGSIAGIKTVNYDKATKGAERSMADGGGVGMEPFKSDSHERFVKAFDTISGLMTRARGGPVGKADGGPIGPWETTVTPASPGLDYKAFGDKLQKMGQPAPMGNDDGGLAAAQASLSSFMSNMQRPRYDNGGAVEWGETGPAFPVSGIEPPSFLGAGPAPVSRSALPPPRMSNAPMTDDDLYGAIKGFEGFNPRAYGDYKQNSVGYGTRATSPNEVITQEEADRRLRDEVSRARTIVDKFAPNIDPGTRAALTSLTFNAGDDWTRAGLGDAIRSGNMEDARSRFLQYTKAGGQDLPGLVNRRQAEAAWFGGAAPPPDESPEGARLAASMRPQQAPASSGEVMLASGRGTVPTGGAAQGQDSWLTRILPGLKEGIWTGKPATPMQRFGTALMSVRGPMFEGPLNGVARNVMEWEQGRQRERQIDNEVNRLMGQVGGQPIMEARRLALEEAKNPEEIKRIQAMTKAAELQTDKAYQLEVARATAEMQKDVARADLEQRAGMVERLFPSNQPPAAGASTRMRWVPTPPPQTPIPAPASGTPPPPPQTAPARSSPQTMQRQSSEPSPDSPAARSAIRRSEASDKLRSRQTERKTEQAAIQTQFNSDSAALQPMEFVRKYSDRRGDLTVDQIRKLDAMIDRLSRGTP